ncbi:hypothetical protein H0H87_009009, partial [Tephrocybe sp. NHM501043]
MSVALDGLLTVLRVARQASDWNPFLKAALGGVVAVIDLAKVGTYVFKESHGNKTFTQTVSSNSQDMKDTLDHIQGLLPILKTSVKRLEDRKDGFDEESLMTFA